MNKINVLSILLAIPLLSCHNSSADHLTFPEGDTIQKRIKAPAGYEWVVERPGSFGEYLQNLPLKPAGTKILDYRGKPIGNQSEHVAVLDKAIGDRDLQQCADAIIRLRADYLWDRKKQNEIAFHFTNGDLYKWTDHKKGIRPKLRTSSRVDYVQSAAFDDSFRNFRKYLDIVFAYAGTISLNKETIRVRENRQIKVGDILITPGSPGHAVIIVGSAINARGKKVYLLAEGYTPAQSIHIITNPYRGALNPWYELDVSKSSTITARYLFKETNLRKFRE